MHELNALIDGMIAERENTRQSNLPAPSTRFGPNTAAFSMRSDKLKLAINPDLIDRNVSGDATLYTRGWENCELSITELAELVRNGVAYCAQLSGPRKAANFLACDVASVDVDDGMTLDEAFATEIVRRHASLTYTTARHADDHHRFRIVFVLPRTIEDAKEMAAVNRSLQLRLSGDPSAVDATRISFGNRQAKTWVYEDRQISSELLEELIAQCIEPEQSDVVGDPNRTATPRSSLRLQPSQQVRLANGTTVPFSQTKRGDRIHCPFHHDKNPSAFVVTNRTGGNGIHCSACAQTFWPTPDEFDFDGFDAAVKDARAYFDRHHGYGPLTQFFRVPDAIPELTLATVDVVKGQAVPDELKPGLTLIKSPKATGKTEGLRRLTHDAKKVLLIGHRRALIRQSCRRLELACYLDAPFSDRFGVCLDSLGKVPMDRPCDYVLLDESEQVLSHFLADTFDQKHRVFVQFGEIVRRAKYVVALDADLSWVTFQTLTRMRSGA